MSTFPLPHTNHDLTGEIALVTGATSGLGWRFAQVLASAGATVAIAGRREENLTKLEELITSQGGKAHPYVLDVSDVKSLSATVEKITAEVGTITILINNAGVVDAQLVTKMSDELIESVIDINLKAPLILAREVAKRLIKEKKPGRIVNIASIAAFSYSGNGAALYSTTKAAVARLAETLAVEWARFHINVNAIAPGAFSSEMMDGMVSRMGRYLSTLPTQALRSTRTDGQYTALSVCSSIRMCHRHSSQN